MGAQDDMKSGYGVMKKEFYWIGVLLLTLWLIRIVDAFIPYNFVDWGLVPRTVGGLPGVVLTPFIHANFTHLFSNTFSLAILLALVVGSRKSPWVLIGLTSLAGSGLLWLVGRSANHVGASGLVFGLIGLLIVNGLLQRSLVPVAVAILVGVLFGGTLFSGILPGTEGVSWDGHLCGFIGGAAVAYAVGDDRRML